MQKVFYWPHMTIDVYSTVSNCSACAHNSTSPKMKRELQLFPVSSPREFVSIEILGPLPFTVNRNRYVMVTTDRSSKLTRSVWIGMTLSLDVANVFLDFLVVPYDISAHILMGNGLKFTKSLFATLCTMLGRKHFTTTAYHP